MRKPNLAALEDRAKATRLRLEIAGNERALASAKAYVNKNVQGGPDRSRGWTIIGPPERDLATFDRRSIIAQTRQKIEESPIVAGLIQTDMDNILGAGFRLAARTDDAEYNKEVETRWNAVKDTLDVRGEYSWGALQRLWATRRSVDGDVALLLGDDPKQSLIQTIEADRIYKRIADAYDSGRDFDDFGRCIAYYFGPRQKVLLPGTQIAQPNQYPASRVLFHANYGPSLRVERERGTSAFLTHPNIVQDLEEILAAMLLKVKNESFAALKFKTMATGAGAPFGNESTTEITGGDGATRRFVKMVRGTNFDLDPNEDVELVGMASPNSDFVPFLRFIIRIFGLPFGMPLEMLMMDPSETNYSGLRSLLEFAKKRFRVAQAEEAALASRVFAWWIGNEIKFRGLKPTDTVTNPTAHSWILPAWPYLDPLKEAQANDLNLKNLLTTPQRIIEQDGGSFDEVVHELTEAKGAYESSKLTPSWLQTGTKPPAPPLQETEKVET